MPAIATAFKSIQADEDNHVQLLIAAITALGARLGPRRRFIRRCSLPPQTSVNTFVSLAGALGNTETGAYIAAVPLAALDSSTPAIAWQLVLYAA